MKLLSYVLIMLLGLSAANALVAYKSDSEGSVYHHRPSSRLSDESKRKVLTLTRALLRASKEESLSPIPSDEEMDQSPKPTRRHLFEVRK